MGCQKSTEITIMHSIIFSANNGLLVQRQMKEMNKFEHGVKHNPDDLLCSALSMITLKSFF